MTRDRHDPKSRGFFVRLSSDLAEAVDAAAAREERTRASIIRRALRLYLSGTGLLSRKTVDDG